LRGELLKRYDRFKKAINLLEELSRRDYREIMEDYILLSSLERNIQVAVEFLIDLSNYILAETTGETPDTYKDIVSRVGKLCNIDDQLIREIRGIVGLKNIIVHLYADIDYELVLGELKDIVNNMFKFVSELLQCINRLELDPRETSTQPL